MSAREENRTTNPHWSLTAPCVGWSKDAAQRVPDMARLRVIGAEGSRLFRLLMIEALLLAALGVLVGLGAGIVLAHLLVPLVTQSMGVIFQLRFSTNSLALTTADQWLAVGAGITAALFASFFAAREVARSEPLAVLRGNHAAASQRVPASRFVIVWIFLVAVSMAALAGEVHFSSIALGNLGATLWNASAIVIAVPIIIWVTPLLRRSATQAFGPAGRVAVESLVRSARRSGITVAAIALVMTVGIFVSSLALSSRQSMRAYIGQSLAADLTVSAVATEGGWLETPLPESLAGELRGIDGVRSVETISVLAGQPYAGMRIGVAGMSEGFFDVARYPHNWFREGDPARASAVIRRGEGVNISTGLADRTGLHAGESITLETPTGPLTLPIVGIVPDYISDKGTVLMVRRLVQTHWLVDTVHRFNVFVDPSVPLERVRKAIASTIGTRYKIKVLSLREVLAYHDDKIDTAFSFTAAIQLLVIIVTVAGIFDLLVSA